MVHPQAMADQRRHNKVGEQGDNSQPQQGQLRKTRLTLKQLSKLRQMSDVRQYEYNEKLKDIRKQYAPPAQPPGL